MAALFCAALIGALGVSEIYQRIKYPDLPRHEVVGYDVGAVFILTFIGVMGLLMLGWWVQRKSREQSRG